jgi:hypothetical protein
MTNAASHIVPPLSLGTAKAFGPYWRWKSRLRSGGGPISESAALCAVCCGAGESRALAACTGGPQCSAHCGRFWGDAVR